MPKIASTLIEEHEAEESYFVSMTDIMVGLLFIFIIIIMYFSMQIRNEPVVLKSIHVEVVAERDNLQASLIELLALNEELRLQNKKLQEEIKLLRLAVDAEADLKTRINELLALNEELVLRNKKLQEEIKLLRLAVDAEADLKTRISELLALNEELGLRNKKLLDENKLLRLAVDAEADFKTRIKELTTENLKLRASIRKLNREVSRILEVLGLHPKQGHPEDVPSASLTEELAALVRTLGKLEVNALDQYVAQADNRKEQILKEMQSLMSEAGFKVEIIPEQGILRLSNNLLFPNGQSEIVAGTSAYKAAKSLARALKIVLPCFTQGEISDPNQNCNPSSAFVEAVFIEGHTDNVPVLGEIEPGVNDNLDLSAKRATNTYRRLVEAEPDLMKLQSVGLKPVLNIAAFGKTRPIADNQTKQGRDKNRRIDIRILMYTPRSERIINIQKLVPVQ